MKEFTWALFITVTVVASQMMVMDMIIQSALSRVKEKK